MEGFPRAKMVCGDSAFCGGFALSYRYFALGISFVRAFWRRFPAQKNSVRNLTLGPNAKTAKSGFGKSYRRDKNLRKLLSVPKKAFSQKATPHLPYMVRKNPPGAKSAHTKSGNYKPRNGISSRGIFEVVVTFPPRKPQSQKIVNKKRIS